MRLIKGLSGLVHADQSGFMPKRNTRLNLRHLHTILGQVDKIGEDALVLSLDARMAFDSIEWSYMMAALSRMGFGPNFLSWLQLLYAEPLAQVRVNGKLSNTFALQRGTRQGCPLSPLIFALILEHLAFWIRGDLLVRGLRWDSDWEDKISLYADDILLYLTDPAASLDRVMHIISQFGSYSGYTINWSKSVIYNLHGSLPKLPRDCGAQIAEEGFK